MVGRVVAGLVGAVVIGGGAVAATRSVPPAPVVSMSTCTLRPAAKHRDTVCVVVAWTKPAGVESFRVAARSTWWGAAAALRTTARRDTLNVPRVVCYVRDTVIVAVVGDGPTGSSATRTARLALPCRAPTVAESAEVDTFGLRWEIRDSLGRTALTVDSGRTLQTCLLRRNRFTGQVQLVVPIDAHPTHAAYCEAARLSAQNARST